MEHIQNGKKEYWSLDGAKLLCALTILASHFASEWGNFPTMVDYGFSIYVIAVPFFYCCSGFLFFRKWCATEQRRSCLIRYEKRLWVMYGCWSVVYMIFVVRSWILKGIFGWQQILKWLHMAVVIQTYATIWFLPALAIGVAVTCFLVTRCSKRSLLITAGLLYLFGMLGHTYSFLVADTPLGGFFDWYLLVFKTSRNGLFNGVPFVVMGYLLAQKDIRPDPKAFRRYGLSAAGLLVLVAAESFFLKVKFGVTGMDIGIALVPFTWCFVMALLHLEWRPRPIWMWCRRCSLLIFLSQRLFLNVLPSLLPDLFERLYANSWLGLALVIGLTMAFSTAMAAAAPKVKCLKMMM